MSELQPEIIPYEEGNALAYRCIFCAEWFVCGKPRIACFDCEAAIIPFWRIVCRQAEAKSPQRSSRERFDSFHYEAATYLVARIKRDSEASSPSTVADTSERVV